MGPHTSLTGYPPAFLHQTDLFRPHNDPDDHWDLLCAFALAKSQRASPAGILIDYPPGPPVLIHASDPDLGAVAQLSFLSETFLPVAIGCPEAFSDRGVFSPDNVPCGVRFVVEHMKKSSGQIFITIVGSARDIAEAIAREPELFRDKCAGIYLNAGSGSRDPASIKALEWNVALDPAGYAMVFQAPCPVFWMPCLEDEDRVAGPQSREYAAYYRFRQRDILDDLPPRLRNYFGSMFARDATSFWLKALDAEFEEILREKGQDYRVMYSTACFFHLAGLDVTLSGELVPASEGRSDIVYRFEPIDIACTADGFTTWKPAIGPANRYLLHVLDTIAYPAAMAAAMKQLICEAFT